MRRRTRSRTARTAAEPSRRLQAGRERLAFGYSSGAVASRALVDATLARDLRPTTFATAAYAEPRDWGYGGLLAFTAVLLLRPQDSIPGLSALHLAEVCAIIGLAPMLMYRFAQRIPVFRVTPETVALMAFGAVMLVTVPFSIWPGGALSTFTESFAKMVLVFILMVNTLTTPKRLERLTWLVVLCCGFIAARSVFDYVRGANLVENGRLSGPVSGIFGNPNDLALNMVTFMPAAALVALSPRRNRSERLVAAAITVLMLAVVVFTKSRAGALGLVITLAAMVILGRKVRPGLGAIAIIGVLAATPFLPDSFWSRMYSIVDEKQDKQEYTGSREARRIVMQEGWDAFVEHPITGVGAGQFKAYNPPQRRERWRETHNMLLQVAAETGLFGLIAFSFLLVRAAIVAVRTRRILGWRPRARDDDPLARVLSDDDRHVLYTQSIAMTAGLVGWFTCALFASVAYNWTFYYLLAIIVAMHELTRERLAAARVIADPQAGNDHWGRRGHLRWPR